MVAGKRGHKRWETDDEWRKRLGDEKWAQLQTWIQTHHWFPYQLRHNAATYLREQYGLEMARIILGHSSAVTTEIYAEVDYKKAEQIMQNLRKIG
jgi:site-specific recombinase XerD